MEGSSNTISEESNINGGVVIFKNKLCRCGMKAGVRISESSQNPGKLFFFCEKRQCKFFKWWQPDETEFMGSLQSHEERNRNSIEIGLLNAMMHRLECSLNGSMQNLERSLNQRMQNLEGNYGYKFQSEMIMLANMLLFGLSIYVFYVSLMNM